jgi:hypothetical protein
MATSSCLQATVPLQASRMIKRYLDQAKEKGAPVDHLYEVMTDINSEFKALMGQS